ncbi:major facilitator superfamily domain-containing protein [Pelagophyceae sp. CCMP2097]|nr:major facilitator superfamily domain-containing protein [Pelagophyceae sp. CCMP2097]
MTATTPSPSRSIFATSGDSWLQRTVAELTGRNERLMLARLRADATPAVALNVMYPDGEHADLELLTPHKLSQQLPQVLALSLSSAAVGAVYFWAALSRDFVVVGALQAGAVVGAYVTPALAEEHGRFRVVLLSDVLLLGMLAAAAHPPYYGAGLAGIGAGVVRTVVPLLLAEVSPITSRGAVGFVYGCALAVGAAAAAALALLGPPDAVAALVAALVLLQLLAFRCVPESPRWLLRHVRVEALLRALVATEVVSAETAFDDGLDYVLVRDGADDRDECSRIAERDLALFDCVRRAVRCNAAQSRAKFRGIWPHTLLRGGVGAVRGAAAPDVGGDASLGLRDTFQGACFVTVDGVGGDGELVVRVEKATGTRRSTARSASRGKPKPSNAARRAAAAARAVVALGAAQGVGDSGVHALAALAGRFPGELAVAAKALAYVTEALVVACGAALVRCRGRRAVLRDASAVLAASAATLCAVAAFPAIAKGAPVSAAASVAVAAAAYIAVQALLEATVLWVVLVELFQAHERAAALALLNVASSLFYVAVPAVVLAVDQSWALQAALAALAVNALGMLAAVLALLPGKAPASNFTGRRRVKHPSDSDPLLGHH